MARDRDDAMELMLHRRNLRPESLCGTCGGWGVRQYSSGATWRGGVGTCSMQADVCNICWGSGDAAEPWLNLKTLEEDKEAEIQKRALTLLADHAGVQMKVMQPAINELVLELERFTRGRKARKPFFVDLCLGLINVLTKR